MEFCLPKWWTCHLKEAMGCLLWKFKLQDSKSSIHEFTEICNVIIIAIKYQWSFVRLCNIMFKLLLRRTLPVLTDDCTAGLFGVCDQPMRDNVTMKRCLTLTGRTHEIIHALAYQHKAFNGRNWFQVQLSAVITRSNTVRYCINDCRNSGRISIRCWIQKDTP